MRSRRALPTRSVVPLLLALALTPAVVGCTALGEPRDRLERESSLDCRAATDSAGDARQPCEADDLP